MNMSLSEVLRTARNGQISKVPNVYLRGSSVRFIALPDLLKNAPVFQKVTAMKRKMEQAQLQRQQQLTGTKVSRVLNREEMDFQPVSHLSGFPIFRRAETKTRGLVLCFNVSFVAVPPADMMFAVANRRLTCGVLTIWPCYTSSSLCT